MAEPSHLGRGTKDPAALPSPRGLTKGQSLWKDAWRRLRRNRFAMGGLVIVVVMVFSAVFAPWLVGYQADYGQPWIQANPPGFSQPAVLAENRFDRKKPVAVPEGIPDSIRGYLTQPGTLRFRFRELARDTYRIKIRHDRVESIQKQQGATFVRELKVSGRDEYLVKASEGGKKSKPAYDLDLKRRAKLAADFPFGEKKRSYVLILDRVRPKTQQPETAEVVLADGVVKTITRDGKPVDALRVDGRFVSEVQRNGAPQVLHHLLGTDLQGRDVLTRVLYGGRISLMVGGVATLVSVLIGVIYGAIAGYLAGRRMDVGSFLAIAIGVFCAAAMFLLLPAKVAWVLALASLAGVPLLFAGRLRRTPAGWLRRPVTTVGEFMMRIVDILYALPFMFLVILLMVLFGRDLLILFVALGAVQWLTMAYIVRGQVLSLKEKEFVEAARMSGTSNTGILFRHLIPNTLGVVVVYATLTVPAVILQESFLAFIGLTVQFHGRALDSWGALVDQGRLALSNDGGRWWILLFPSLAMALTLFSLNFLGDGLRDALDPKLKGRG